MARQEGGRGARERKSEKEIHTYVWAQHLHQKKVLSSVSTSHTTSIDINIDITNINTIYHHLFNVNVTQTHHQHQS
eukprot:m.166791 g.166791  ORF g.166791 m.166791 type:complete len:76 (-) comp31438_c8_seq8:943-1170(-)